MNPKSVLLALLVAGIMPAAAVAQAAPAASPAAPAAQAAPAAPAAQTGAPAPSADPMSPAMQSALASAISAPPPQAYPAKVALVAFEQAVYGTNEGMRAADEIRKKFQPQKDKIDALATEVDTLKKQLQAAPATLTDAERAQRLKTIDSKDKEYQRQVDDATNAYQSDLQEALGKIAQKVSVVMQDYVEKNGYTILLNIGDQQSPVMWWAKNPNADITLAVVAAYNASSGVTAPPPDAPSAPAARPKAPAGTAPHAPASH
jgi:Skp family chaperone for outer membrane proteins